MNLKKLREKREELLKRAEELQNVVEVEERALTGEECGEIDKVLEEVRNIDTTIEKLEEARALENLEEIIENKNGEETREEEGLVDFIKSSGKEERDLKAGDNGVVIPNTIANRIIEKTKELCPILNLATVYNVGGDLTFVVDNDDLGITADYVDEFTELTEKATKFTAETLKANIIGVLAKVSKSLINRAGFNVLDYVIKKVAESIAVKIEKAVIVGDTKVKGLFDTTNTAVEKVETKDITADDLIGLQTKLKAVHNGNAVWVLNRETFATIRKLKDGQGQYLLTTDLLNGGGYNLLGRPVIISDNAPKAEKGKGAVVYGDLSGVFIKFASQFEMQVLNEKYATQFAVGVVAFTEFDAKVIEKEKIVRLDIKATA